MDAEILDLCKENIQPLRQGRKANCLGLALQAQTDAEIQEKLTKDREQYELAIIAYEGDDPLEPRYDYIQWVEQSYPKRGREANIIPLLEDTIMLFKDDDRYKQDIRFVELIVKYIESQENDVELFQMVYGQGLGTMCSLFYKSWADALDRNLDIKRADQVYQIGISNRAQPLDSLQAAHSLFQMSVGRRMMAGDLPCPGKQVSVETSERQRKVLGKLKKATTVRNTSSNPGKYSALNVSNQNKKSTSFAVFQENENEPFATATHKFNIVNTESTHKENTIKPGPWNQGIKKKKVPEVISVPSTPKFQICMDSDEESPPESKKQPTPASSKVLKIRKAEILQDPMALFKSPHPGAKNNIPKFEVFAGGKDFSFEEIRWAHYKKHENPDEQTPLKRSLQFTPCKSETPMSEMQLESPMNDGFATPLKRAPRPLVKTLFMPLPEEEEEENHD